MLLSLFCVSCFYFGFFGLPPVFVGFVPVDSCLEAITQVRKFRLPAQLGAKLGAVNSISLVMAGAVGHMFVIILVFAHKLEDSFDNVFIVLLAVGSNEVQLTQLAFV